MRPIILSERVVEDFLSADPALIVWSVPLPVNQILRSTTQASGVELLTNVERLLAVDQNGQGTLGLNLPLESPLGPVACFSSETCKVGRTR